jgi:hypothetical protein
VLTKIKSKLNIKIIGFGCNVHTHIIYNFAKTTFDSMPVDIRVLVMKSFEYPQIHKVRLECVKDFYDFARQEQKEILSYANVRWLSLLSVLERILKI